MRHLPRRREPPRFFPRAHSRPPRRATARRLRLRAALELGARCGDDRGRVRLAVLGLPSVSERAVSLLGLRSRPRDVRPDRGRRARQPRPRRRPRPKTIDPRSGNSHSSRGPRARGSRRPRDQPVDRECSRERRSFPASHHVKPISRASSTFSSSSSARRARRRRHSSSIEARFPAASHSPILFAEPAEAGQALLEQRPALDRGLPASRYVVPRRKSIDRLARLVPEPR